MTERRQLPEGEALRFDGDLVLGRRDVLGEPVRAVAEVLVARPELIRVWSHGLYDAGDVVPEDSLPGSEQAEAHDAQDRRPPPDDAGIAAVGRGGGDPYEHLVVGDLRARRIPQLQDVRGGPYRS